jgi:hypothetical protein
MPGRDEKNTRHRSLLAARASLAHPWRPAAFRPKARPPPHPLAIRNGRLTSRPDAVDRLSGVPTPVAVRGAFSGSGETRNWEIGSVAGRSAPGKTDIFLTNRLASVTVFQNCTARPGSRFW